MIGDDTDVRWEPSQYYRSESNIAQFEQHYQNTDDFTLYPESDAEIRTFWDAVVDEMGIVWEQEYTDVFESQDGIEFTDWFVNGRLNPVDTVLTQWAQRHPEQPALIWEDERGNSNRLTYRALEQQVDKIADAFVSRGVTKGDVVAIVYPLNPRAFASALACLKIGAIQTQIFPGYGSQAIRKRLDDSDASVVITADGYQYKGKTVKLAGKLEPMLSALPTLEHVVIDDYVGIETPDHPRTISWTEFISERSSEAETRIMDSEDPVGIAYTSGTTGEPKGTIHTAGSLLAVGMKDMYLQQDVSEGDRYLWVTDFGWITVTSYLLLGALGLGATTVLLEGAMTYPDEQRLWSAVETYDASIVGMAPTGARKLHEINDAPRETHDLTSIRVLGSTGEPWDATTWNWYLDSVGDGTAPIINCSGGTELGGVLLSPTPLTPLKPGTLFGPAPGVPAAVYDESGTPTRDGYLVVEGPFPGMTRSLTAGDDRYLSEYWRDFEGVWNQNDRVQIDDDGHWYVTGRFDDTINVAGRRITLPSIEEVLLGIDEITEVVVIGVSDEARGEVPVAFLKTDTDGDASMLREKIHDRIDAKLGAPYRPAEIHLVPEIPRTQTDKVPRKVIERIYTGADPGDTSTLKNADVLETFPTRDN